LAADRFFSHQPNVPGKGIVASYNPTFWALVARIGLIAGLAGAALMELLHAIEHLVWSYDSGSFLRAVEATTAAHRVLVLLAGGEHFMRYAEGRTWSGPRGFSHESPRSLRGGRPLIYPGAPLPLQQLRWFPEP
jgi:hypothetical protein